MRSPISPRQAYLVLLLSVGITLTGIVIRFYPPSVDDVAPVLLFAAFSFLAELKPVSLGTYQGAISMGTALDLAALFIFGPFVVLASALLSEIAVNMVLGRRGWRTVFNTTQLLVSNAATGLTYMLLRFHSGPLELISDTPAIVAAVGVRLLVNTCAVALAFSVQHTLPFQATWKTLLSHVPVAHYLFQAPLAVLAAVVYYHEPFAVVLVFVPLYINYLSVQRYAALTRLNNQLEEMVRKRTEDLLILNEKLENAYRQLQREEENRRQLMANISHDLRTPLSSVQGYVEALLDGVARSEAQFRRYLAVIHDKTQMLDRLIDDLFQLSCLESGQLQMNMKPGDIVQLASDVVDRWRVEAENAEISIREELPQGLPAVPFDGARIEQVLTNLITNALRHTPPGGEIIVSAFSKGEAVVLSVKDTGEGIPPEDLPHVFERFYRGEKSRSRSRGGSGLGLAIARQILLAHKGTIEVESRLGEGTEFTVTLPVCSQLPTPS